MATLTTPSIPTNPREDAIQLHTALKGLVCDTAAVINILAHRDATQRCLIQKEYETLHSQDLLGRLTSKLTGNLKTAVLLWMHDSAGRDAILVREALVADRRNLKAVTELICSRTPSQIELIKQQYLSNHESLLIYDVGLNNPGDSKNLLVAYMGTPRNEGLEFDRDLASKDAKALFKAGENKLGTDEDTFIRIFSGRSRSHLAAVSAAYRSLYGHSLKKAVVSETSGNFSFGLLTILQCCENPAKYFAKILGEAMKGWGTDDTTLIRVIVTRAEIDMHHIKGAYLKKYKKTLNDAVKSETSGHYRTFLLSLLGTNH